MSIPPTRLANGLHFGRLYKKKDPGRAHQGVERLRIAGQPADAHVIVDTGSSSFVPLLHYVVTNEVPSILSQGGNQLVVHTVVTGGQSLADTLTGAAQLVKQLDAARFVIWLNPFWGPVAHDGKTFEQMKTYLDMKTRIETVVSLPAFTDELFPQDIASMLKSRRTFKEAIESPDQSLMSRHRLKVAQREFYSRLDSLAV
jgi:hypothetical protein